MNRTHRTLDIHRQLTDVQNKVENCPCFEWSRHVLPSIREIPDGILHVQYAERKEERQMLIVWVKFWIQKNTCSCHFMHHIHAFDCMAVHCSPHDVTCHATPRHAMPWHDMTWHHMTSHDMTCHDTTRQDITVHHMTWHDMAWHGMAWHGSTRNYIALALTCFVLLHFAFINWIITLTTYTRVYW